MKKRLKKKLYSFIVYGGSGDLPNCNNFMWKTLNMHNRWRLYERLAIKEGLLTVERKWTAIPLATIDKSIKKALQKEYKQNKD